MTNSIIRTMTVLLVFAGLVGCRSYNVPGELQGQGEDYLQARTKFQTRLTVHSRAPQQYDNVTSVPGATAVRYGEGLSGYLAKPPQAGEKSPAVLFLHGGFAFGADDFEMATPYLNAGYVVMVPILRGENGQSGEYSMFYNEVSDVIAAADYLASQPFVDSKHIYLAGHSVGGTLTLLASQCSNRFKAATSFSGSCDQIAWAQGQPELVPFDLKDAQEFRMRSPIAFATSFKCPVRIMYGGSEMLFAGSSKKTAELAKAKGLDVEAMSVPGDHFTAVGGELKASLEFFASKR